MGAEQLWQASGSRGGDGQLNMSTTHHKLDHKRKIGSNEKKARSIVLSYRLIEDCELKA